MPHLLWGPGGGPRGGLCAVCTGQRSHIPVHTPQNKQVGGLCWFNSFLFSIVSLKTNPSELNGSFCFIVQFKYGRGANTVTWRVPRVCYALCHASPDVGGGGVPAKAPHTDTATFADVQATKSWYPRLSVDNSLPTLVFIKTLVHFSVGGGHTVLGGEGAHMGGRKSHQKECTENTHIA